MTTHVVVRDTPPPSHVMTVGHLYPLGQETAFKTAEPEFVTPEEDFLDESETKVVRGRRGRRPNPKATNEAEVKEAKE